MIIKPYHKIGIGALIGSALGFSYYYFIGCNSGACPITSKWYVSTIYGAFFGIVAVWPNRKKQTKADQQQDVK